MKSPHLTTLIVLSLIQALCPREGVAEGIPEPSLILYGTIRNAAVNNERVTFGTLTWQFTSPTGARRVFSTQVSNILDQFSYVLEVPCETTISTNLSTNALNLSGTVLSFDRSAVRYESIPASFVVPSQSNVLLSARSRGQVERVDLLIYAACVDSDGNGLCDDWELFYFGYIGVDPNADPDGDGMSNWAEFKAGTHPTNQQSAFHFLTYERVPTGGIHVEWNSLDGRYYSLLRYPSLLSTNVVVVQSNIFAVPPRNSLIDTNVPSIGTYFYRLRLQTNVPPNGF